MSPSSYWLVMVWTCHVKTTDIYFILRLPICCYCTQHSTARHSTFAEKAKSCWDQFLSYLKITWNSKKMVPCVLSFGTFLLFCKCPSQPKWTNLKVKCIEVEKSLYKTVIHWQSCLRWKVTSDGWHLTKHPKVGKLHIGDHLLDFWRYVWDLCMIVALLFSKCIAEWW